MRGWLNAQCGDRDHAQADLAEATGIAEKLLLLPTAELTTCIARLAAALA